MTYRMQQSSPGPEAPQSVAVQQQQQQQEESNPELAKYLNRSYWEQRKISESSSMASPSAPSPMPPTPQPQQQQQLLQHQQPSLLSVPKTADELQIDEFAANMRTQVEIFVNRMKSNSSRGRSISNDSSVQTLFMTLTSLHSQQLSYIKEMDDKRMWYEQLQDKLAQIKDSRAALDVLRQEHVEKLRLIAEEQERQRQLQMAQKLEIMRKKKQEYLQYQRQLAVQRIQEQEREMQLRQEQQKAQYLMGQTAPPFPYLPHGGSPSHQLNNVYMPYANPAGYPAANGHGVGQFAGGIPPPGMYNPALAQAPPAPGMMMMPPQQQQQQQQPQQTQPDNNPYPGQPMMQQQQQQPVPPHTQPQVQQQQLPPQVQTQPQPQPHLAHVMLQQQQIVQSHPPLPTVPQVAAAPPPQQQQQQQQVLAAPRQPAVDISNTQVQAVAAAPAPPQNDPEPAPAAKAPEPATAELISFD